MASEGRRVIGAIVAAILWPVMTALARREPAERASIWSLGRQSARVFFPLAFLLWAAALAWCAYDTPVTAPATPPQPAYPADPASQAYPANPASQAHPASPPRVLWYEIAADYIERTLQRFGAIVIPLTVTAMMLSPILAAIGRGLMTLSQWITANWVAPHIQKIEARGEAKSNAEWRAWLERKNAAEAQGQAFDEPPPDDRE